MTQIDELKDIASEAKTEFNLMERLRGRPTRTAEVTVYLDEVTGAEHARVATELAAAKLASANPEDYSGLEAQERELARKVRSTGITFHLRATPDIVNKKADRDTRKHLKIKGNVPAELLTDYSAQYTARIFRDTVEKWVDHETGTTHKELTVDEALGLKELLPTGQFDRLDSAVADLNFKAQISDAITGDTDF